MQRKKTLEVMFELCAYKRVSVIFSIRFKFECLNVI